MMSFTSGSISSVDRLVNQETTKNTRNERTRATADAVTPAGNVKSLRYAAVSSDNVTTRPIAIEAIAPSLVAPSQLSPTASAGTSVDAKSPQPNIPRNATIAPEY